jgi:hypothetical protein
MTENRTGLVAPYGTTSTPEPTTAEEIREQIDAPVRNAHAGALKDAVLYLTDNAVNGSDHNVRAAINIRWNLSWTTVDQIISEARPLAEREIEKVRAERIKNERERVSFQNLVALFAVLGLRIQVSNDRYDLLGLTESQLLLCAELVKRVDMHGL